MHEVISQSGALGRKICFPDGQDATTVPTHAFVAFRTVSTSPMLRIANWYAQIKRSRLHLRPLERDSDEPTVVTPRHQPTSNSPVGKAVFLARSSQRYVFEGTLSSLIHDDLCHSLCICASQLLGPSRWLVNYCHWP
jgi:hypothetical protein